MKNFEGFPSTDAELSLKFALNFDETSHLVVSNSELNICKNDNYLDGNMAKVLASGGDSVIDANTACPALSFQSVEYYSAATSLPIEPADAKSTLLVFKLNGIFASEKGWRMIQKRRYAWRKKGCEAARYLWLGLR
jgi:hypothetical protein